MEVTDDPIIRDREDRGIGVTVDRNDLSAIRHSRPVLHRTADATGDVKTRTHRDSGLPDLMVVIDPAGIHCRT